jgi:hypothetical protein
MGKKIKSNCPHVHVLNVENPTLEEISAFLKVLKENHIAAINFNSSIQSLSSTFTPKAFKI